MKKFMAVYIAPRAEIDAFMAKPEAERQKEAKADMEEWNAWTLAHKDHFDDGGTMFGKTKRVTKDGVSDSKNELTGYAIVLAENYDDAAAIFEGHPYLNFPGASVEIMECIKMG